MISIPPSHPQITYSDHAWMEVTDEAARFNRKLAGEGGFHFDNPGARIRICTDATTIRARLMYDGLHSRLDALNGTGIYLVDGQVRGTYANRDRETELHCELETAGDGLEHLYEILLPYGESVEFRGLELNAEASMAAVPARPRTRWVAYGDSITQGYSAGHVGRNYPFLIGELRQWQVINMGFGSRQATPVDGMALGQLNPSVVTVAIGANDCLHAKPLAAFQDDVLGLLGNIQSHLPSATIVPIYVVTPLPVPDRGWDDAETRLAKYRATLRDTVNDLQSTKRCKFKLHLIEGSDLIPADARYFQDGLHPNDPGFQLMAEKLSARMRDVAPTS